MIKATFLGCEAMAANGSPEAWFFLQRKLHCPQLLAGESRPLPAFAVSERVFFEEHLTARAVRGALARYGAGDGEAVRAASPHTGLASLVENTDFAARPRAWGRWAAGRDGEATGDTLSVGARRILRRTGEAARSGVVRRAHWRTALAPQPTERCLPLHVGPSAFRTGSGSRGGTVPCEAAPARSGAR